MSSTLHYASLEHPRYKTLPPPPDFTSPPTAHRPTRTPHPSLKQKRAWDLALSPAKSLPMQAFMLYMSGGGVQIFSMGIVLMLLVSPLRNVAGIHAAFAPFASTGSPGRRSSLWLQKWTYVCCNVLTLLVGLWKCRSMGLLPTGTGDWLAFETRSFPPEISL